MYPFGAPSVAIALFLTLEACLAHLLAPCKNRHWPRHNVVYYSVSYSAAMASRILGADALTRQVAPSHAGSLRRTVSSAVTVVAAALLVSSCGSGSGDGAPPTSSPNGAVTTTATQGQLELGEEVYAGNCATCHGAAGEGGFGPELAGGAVVERYSEVGDHRAVVVSGRGAMPAWGDTLTEEEIDAVVRYERERLGRP